MKQIEAERSSLNTEGVYEGGGVCVDCKHNTAGTNCQHCKEGYYRPKDVRCQNYKFCLNRFHKSYEINLQFGVF